MNKPVEFRQVVAIVLCRVGLAQGPVHAIFSYLLLDCHDAELCSTGNLSIEATTHPLGPCTASRLQGCGLYGGVHCQCPVSSSFDVGV